MSDNRIALTGKAKETVAQNILQMNQIQQGLQNLIQIVVESKGLEGSWGIDVNTLELVKQEDKPKTE
jgi:hypothetical protein